MWKTLLIARWIALKHYIDQKDAISLAKPWNFPLKIDLTWPKSSIGNPNTLCPLFPLISSNVCILLCPWLSCTDMWTSHLVGPTYQQLNGRVGHVRGSPSHLAAPPPPPSLFPTLVLRQMLDLAWAQGRQATQGRLEALRNYDATTAFHLVWGALRRAGLPYGASITKEEGRWWREARDCDGGGWLWPHVLDDINIMMPNFHVIFLDDIIYYAQFS
jgi:hypothetical protein